MYIVYYVSDLIATAFDLLISITNPFSLHGDRVTDRVNEFK